MYLCRMISSNVNTVKSFCFCQDKKARTNNCYISISSIHLYAMVTDYEKKRKSVKFLLCFLLFSHILCGEHSNNLTYIRYALYIIHVYTVEVTRVITCYHMCSPV